MKICQIMASKGEGGLEKYFIEVCNALAKKHEVHVIADAEFANAFQGVTFYAVDMTGSRRNLFLLNRVRRIITDLQPDIVHAHANKAATIIATLKPFLPSVSRLVATIHSVKRNCASFEKFHHVMGDSSRALENINNPNQTIIYIGLELPPSRFKPRSYLLDSLGIPEDQKILVSIGRLVTVKRFDILIQAFANIENAHLVLVGEGRDRQMLEMLAQDLSIKNIHFMGHRTDNIEILSAADLCVISSEREGFPYALVESLLAKTPVISTDVSDMKLVLPKQAVVPINDPEALHQLIANTVNNYDELLKNDYQKTFEWAQQNLIFNNMIEKIEQVYRKPT